MAKAPILTRVVAGMAIATPVTIIGAGAAFAAGVSSSIAALIGAALGAISGLLAQAAVEDGGDQDHE